VTRMPSVVYRQGYVMCRTRDNRLAGGMVVGSKCLYVCLSVCVIV